MSNILDEGFDELQAYADYIHDVPVDLKNIEAELGLTALTRHSRRILQGSMAASDIAHGAQGEQQFETPFSGILTSTKAGQYLEGLEYFSPIFLNKLEIGKESQFRRALDLGIAFFREKIHRTVASKALVLPEIEAITERIVDQFHYPDLQDKHVRWLLDRARFQILDAYDTMDQSMINRWPSDQEAADHLCDPYLLENSEQLILEAFIALEMKKE